jgi:DNA invertase Pin-like site-specific DNA recombinase
MGELNAVVYCRVACADYSALDQQEKMVRQYADTIGYAITNGYSDNGYSGLSLNRPGINDLLLDIQVGNIKTVITKDVARIARSMASCMEFFDIIERHNVTLITVDDGIVELPLLSRFGHMASGMA